MNLNRLGGAFCEEEDSDFQIKDSRKEALTPNFLNASSLCLSFFVKLE